MARRIKTILIIRFVFIAENVLIIAAANIKMIKKIRHILIYLVIFEWHVFGMNPQHTNYSEVAFKSNYLRLAWEFELNGHIWEHNSRRSVWSSSAVGAKVGDDFFIFVGSYTNNLFCINVKDGKEAWRYTTGGVINSAPVFCRVKGKPVVIVASCDRVIYCLDAKTGDKLWSYEVYPWTFTVFEAVTSSPVVVEVNGSQNVILCIWYSDRSPFKNIQKGEALCLDVLTGKENWRKVIADTQLSSPAFLNMGGKPFIYFSSSGGSLYCISVLDGSVVWRFNAAMPIKSSALITKIKDRDVVIIGGAFGVVFCIDAKEGSLIWKYKTGMDVASSGAVCKIEGRDLLFVPSYDRYLYCLDLSNGGCIWRYEAKKYISSSPLIVNMARKPAVIFASLDNQIYALEAMTGNLLWNYKLGKRLWAYETRGETLWPSPIAISFDGASFLILPWYDGKIYAFGG